MPIIKHTDLIKKGDPLAELKKSLGETNDLVIALTKSNEKLSQSLQSVKKTSDGSEAKKLVTATNALKKSTTELTSAQKERIKLQQKLKVLNSDRIQQNEELKVQISEQRRINKQLAKETLGLVGAYDKLAKKTNEAQKRFKNLAAQFGVNSKQAKKARSEFEKLDNKLRQVNNASKDGRRDVGRYQLALKNLGGQILGAAGIVGGVTLLINGFKNLAAKAKILNKGTRQVASTFKVTLDQAKGLSSQISALASNFDEDYNKIMVAANAVSKEFGISAQASLDLIEEGFRKGSNNSGEFLDILREYPVQLRSVGLSAEESFAIINQQVKAGVYTDKGIDAIKEAGLALRENTKTVQDALKPLNENIKAEIEREVAVGNTFKAMQLISGELDNLTVQQKQVILADIFKGAGEDALSFVENLDELNLSLADTESQTSEVEDANFELSKTWNGLVGEISTGSSFISKAWAGLLRIASGIVEQLNYWLSGQNKINAVTKRSIGFQDRLDKLLAAQRAKIESITDKEAQRTHLIERYQKLQVELAKAERDAAVARESGSKTDIENAIIRIELLNGLIDGLKEYVPELRTSTEATNTNTNVINSNNVSRSKNVTEIDKQSKSLNKLNEQLQRESEFARKEQRDIIGLPGVDQEALDIEGMEVLDAQLEEMLNSDQQYENDRVQAHIDANNKILENEAETQGLIADLKRTVEEEATNFAINAATQISDDKKNKELNRIQAEEDALKNQLDKGLINEIQYERQLAELNKRRRQEEAKATKRQALYEIAIATAIAVAKAVPNLLRMARAAVLGGIQAAFVAAKPIPQFEKGEINIKGKRHKEGGILAEIEDGESVINRQGTANAPILLDSINRGLISDKGLNMNKGKKDNLLAGLLMQGLQDNKDLISLMSNMAYSYEHDGKIVIVPVDGSGVKYKPKK